MRATPLKIITTARRSVHTLMGSKEAFRTKTRAFMVEADITRARRKVSKIGVRSPGSAGILPAVRRHPCRAFVLRAGCSRTADRDVGAPTITETYPSL